MDSKTEKRGKPIHAEARQIIYNVIQFFEREKERGEYYYSVNQAMERASAATGASVQTLRKIRKEGQYAETYCAEMKTPSGKKQRAKPHTLNVIQHSLLRNIINTIYTTENEAPSLGKIMNKASVDVNYGGSKTTLRRILNEDLGYKFAKVGVKKFTLYELPSNVEARSEFLDRIGRNESLLASKRSVVYVGETWIRCDRSKYGKAQRLYMVHAGGEAGFVEGAQFVFKFKWVPGEPRDKITSKIFLKWLKAKLIPNLQPNSIVVLPNAPYSTVDANRPPKKSAKEEELKKWLRDHNIHFKENAARVSLLKLCQKHRPPKQYVVDQCLNMHGHEVLRLPPFNNDLNLMEYILLLIKHKVTDQAQSAPTASIEQLVLAAIANMDSNEYMNEVMRVKMIQRYYTDMDPLIAVQTSQLKVGEDASQAAKTDKTDGDCEEQEPEQEMESDSDSSLSEIEELHFAIEPDAQLN